MAATGELRLRDVYAVIMEAYGGADPVTLAAGGFRWVMDLASYKQIRAAVRAAGVIYPEGDDPDDWAPKPEDRLYGLLVEVREDGGEPHLEHGRA
jgi:hypothetical protein